MCDDKPRSFEWADVIRAGDIPEDAGDEYADGCVCAPEPTVWTLEISGGHVSLTCTTCGKSAPFMDGDWWEHLEMGPLRVRAAWEGDCIPTCTCNPYVQWGCDGNAWLQVTPEKEK